MNITNLNPHMQPRTIELNGQEYRIRKMDAFAGAALLKFMTSKGLPLLAAAQDVFTPNEGKDAPKTPDQEPSDADILDSAIKMIPPLLDAITDEELQSLMTRCLNYCDKKLDAGYQPVMDGNSFGLEEAEGDVFLCVMLCFYVIVHNMQGFFSGSGLNLKAAMTAITSRRKQQTSTNSSLPQ